MAKRGKLDDQGIYVTAQAVVLEGHRRSNPGATGSI